MSYCSRTEAHLIVSIVRTNVFGFIKTMNVYNIVFICKSGNQRRFFSVHINLGSRTIFGHDLRSLLLVKNFKHGSKFKFVSAAYVINVILIVNVFAFERITAVLGFLALSTLSL